MKYLGEKMISVIVPVYNCALYLDKSIQSLIAQTIFRDLEIIFIDDGSTDESVKIIQSYARKYTNMRLICQSNHGVSSARNRGLKEAKGKYVAFFDADDIAFNTLYEELLSLMVDNNVDMSCVNYIKCFSDGVEKVQKKREETILFGRQIIESFFLSNLLCNNTFDKLFKLSIAKKIQFPEGFAIGEDMFFVFKYLLKTKKVAVDTTRCLYRYYIRNNSAMKSEFSEKYFDTIILSKKMMNMVSYNSSIYLLTEANWIHEICKTLALYYQSGSRQYQEMAINYNKYLKSYPVKKAFRYLGKKHFIALLIMKICPKLYIKIYERLHIG